MSTPIVLHNTNSGLFGMAIPFAVHFSLCFVILFSQKTYANQAEIISPEPGSTLTQEETLAQWAPDESANLYKFWVGRQRRGYDLVAFTYVTPPALTSASIVTPLDGRPVYVTLATRVGGTWYYKDYAYQAALVGEHDVTEITSPEPGSTLTQEVTLAQWSPDERANLYKFWVGRQRRGYDLVAFTYVTPPALTSASIVTPLDGRPVYVTLATRVGGTWYYKDYVYQAVSSIDSDGDGIPDWYENSYGLNPSVNDASDDKDVDGVSNLDEYLYGIAANLKDTDSDGISDGGEIRWGLSPSLSIEDAQIFDPDGLSLFGDCDDDKRILHILNRLSFGPTHQLYKELKGDTDCGAVNSASADTAMVEANILSWITAQLTTKGIPGETERRNFGLSANNDPRGPVIPVLNSNYGGYYLDALPDRTETVNDCMVLIEPEHDNGCGFEDNPAACKCENTYDPGQCMRDTHRQYKPQLIAGNMAAIRPLHSNQHLRTFLGKFWDNHFNTDVNTLDQLGIAGRTTQEAFEADTFFMGSLGNFYIDLLLPSAKSPTMLHYLNSIDNIYPCDPEKPNCDYIPNENYAREVLELHTMGEDNGYDQEDIHQLARIFTGWGTAKPSLDAVGDGKTRSRYRAYMQRGYGIDDGSKNKHCNQQYYTGSSIESGSIASSTLHYFYFNKDNHDPAENKELSLGNSNSVNFSAGLAENERLKEGELALKAIADRPETAEFLCGKLASLLVSDKPAQATLDRCTVAFESNKNSENQIRNVVESLIGYDAPNNPLDSNAEFNDSKQHRTKYKDIWEFGYGLGRLLGMDTTTHNEQYNTRLGQVFLEKAKLWPYHFPSPDGWPEKAEDWINTEQAITRMNLTSDINLIKVNPDGRNAAAEIFKQVLDLDMPAECVRDQATYEPFLLKIEHQNDADKKVAGYLLKVMFGGYYDASDVVNAYNVLNSFSTIDKRFFKLNGEDAGLDRPSCDATADLIRLLASSYDYSLQ